MICCYCMLLFCLIRIRNSIVYNCLYIVVMCLLFVRCFHLLWICCCCVMAFKYLCCVLGGTNSPRVLVNIFLVLLRCLCNITSFVVLFRSSSVCLLLIHDWCPYVEFPGHIVCVPFFGVFVDITPSLCLVLAFHFVYVSRLWFAHCVQWHIHLHLMFLFLHICNSYVFHCICFWLGVMMLELALDHASSHFVLPRFLCLFSFHCL